MLRTNERRGPARRVERIRQGFLPRVWDTDRRVSAIPRSERGKDVYPQEWCADRSQSRWACCGKGVVVARTVGEAEVAVDTFLSSVGTSAGKEIVVEEFLQGEEISFFALCDGVIAMPFSSAQDHKCVGEGDKGPNTGGMGAYSPPDIVTRKLTQRIMREIVAPTLRGMNERGSPFRGLLFAGLMVDERGPKVIEFNVRFGDPEAEVILARLKNDLLPLLVACASGTLGGNRPRFSSDAALAVVMAARGYPGQPLRGSRIGAIEDAEFGARSCRSSGSTREVDGAIFADGGRVLTITAHGSDVADARERAYVAINRIKWPEGFFRRDIGWRAIARNRKKARIGNNLRLGSYSAWKRPRTRNWARFGAGGVGRNGIFRWQSLERLGALLCIHAAAAPCRSAERSRDWRFGLQSWPRGSGQIDKWIFCLTPATLAGDQEIR